MKSAQERLIWTRVYSLIVQRQHAAFWTQRSWFESRSGSVEKPKVEVETQEKKVSIQTVKSDTFDQTFIRITDIPIPDDTEIDSFTCEDCTVDVDQNGVVLGVTFTIWHDEAT